MSTSADDRKYKRIASYPRFPVKFKVSEVEAKSATGELEMNQIVGLTLFPGQVSKTFICKAGNLQ